MIPSIAFLFSFALPLGFLSQEDPLLVLERDIAAVEERLIAARSRIEAARRAKLDELLAIDARMAQAQSNLLVRGTESEALELEIRDLESRTRSLKSAHEEISARLTRCAAELEGRLEGSLTALEDPTLATRATELASEGDIAARARSIFDLAAREIALASIASRFRGEVITTSGKRLEVDVIRIGLVEAFYRAEDEVGALVPESDSSWRGMPLGDAAHEDAIRALFEEPKSTDPVFAPIDASGGLAIFREGVRRDWRETFEAGGPVMIPIALVAVLAILLFVERIFVILVSTRQAMRVIEPVRRAVLEGRLEVANSVLDRHRGPASRVMKACIDLRGAPAEVIDRGIEEAMLSEIPRLERALSLLATLGAIAPFLGLLGTITGMITTFDVITASGTNDPSLLSSGISEALITTQAGLVVAIPILLIHTLLSARVDALISRLEQGVAGVTSALAREGRTQ